MFTSLPLSICPDNINVFSFFLLLTTPENLIFKRFSMIANGPFPHQHSLQPVKVISHCGDNVGDIKGLVKLRSFLPSCDTPPVNQLGIFAGVFFPLWTLHIMMSTVIQVSLALPIHTDNKNSPKLSVFGSFQRLGTVDLQTPERYLSNVSGGP